MKVAIERLRGLRQSMNPILANILATGVVEAPDGTKQALHSNIPAAEGTLLQKLIHATKPKVSIEVGCAFGISSLYICEAMSEVGATKHIIIDPHQNDPAQWKGIGLANLQRAGYGQLVEFHQASSFLALPLLHAKKTTVDFAFIDGVHTFDYVLVDFFHIDKMLSPGGIVVFDDYAYPGIKKVVRYILTNLPYVYAGAAGIVDNQVKTASVAGQHPNLANLPDVARSVAIRKLRHDLIGTDKDCNRSWEAHVAF
jgi:predicted O-methyltransferase YrrM